MTDTVSDVAGWVFSKGALTEELMSPTDVADLSALTDEEQGAIRGVRPQVTEEIGEILMACRSAVLDVVDKHPLAAALRSGRSNRAVVGSARQFTMKLVPGRAAVGMALSTWGEPDWHLWLYCLVEPPYRDIARRAVAERLDAADRPDMSRDEAALAFRTNEIGSVLVAFRVPDADESVAGYARFAAAELWSFARPIGEAVGR